MIYMKNRKAFSLIIVSVVMILISSCRAISPDVNKTTEKEPSRNVENITSVDDMNMTSVDDMGISSGSYHGISFGTVEYTLNKVNGEYVIFWAKNTGKVDIRISINEYSKELTLQPNEEGFVSEEFSTDEQDFTFKAVPTPNGGDISIDYKIKQSNTNKYIFSD